MFSFLDHFTQHLKVNQNQAGNSRSEAINANIYAAVLASLKGLVDVKAKTLGNEELKKLAMNIIMSGIISSNANIRCAAAECLGRLAQVQQTTYLAKVLSVLTSFLLISDYMRPSIRDRQCLKEL